MTKDSARTQVITPFPSLECRKSCTVCYKFVYFHQPILFCSVCRCVTHGLCKGIDNNKVFILQQFVWVCDNCSVSHPNILYCETCWGEISIYTENFIQCKNCNLLVHKCCEISKFCFNCSPDKNSATESTENDSVDTNFYQSQPFFEPFKLLENCPDEFLPEPEFNSENIQSCSEILSSCNYYTVDDIKTVTNQSRFKMSSLLFSMNIDGVR